MLDRAGAGRGRIRAHVVSTPFATIGVVLGVRAADGRAPPARQEFVANAAVAVLFGLPGTGSPARAQERADVGRPGPSYRRETAELTSSGQASRANRTTVRTTPII